MERNWLIRTTQKQILGPVAKSKVLEFLEKGALGLNDEVTSGNGYWFSLKEKDLVDKYLFGDVPQAYNPVSESKSILSKRENPDKTTSLNATPANKTQVIQLGQLMPGFMPASTDLEYPDMTLIQAPNTTVSAAPIEEMKLPTFEDLEFPDISLITEAINKSPMAEVNHVEFGKAPLIAEKVEVIVNDEVVIYPKDDDLDYPDFETLTADVTGPKAEFKKFSKDSNNGLELELEIETERTFVVNKGPIEDKKDVRDMKKNTYHEEKITLHERKVKAPFQSATPREVIRDNPTNIPRSTLPEHLKKQNDNYLMYILVILVLILLSLFFYYYRTILNKPLPV